MSYGRINLLNGRFSTFLSLTHTESSLAFGNCNGLAVVDYLQKSILLCMSTLDLYGTADPYQRLTRSPRRNRQSTSGTANVEGTHARTCTHIYTGSQPCAHIQTPHAFTHYQQPFGALPLVFYFPVFLFLLLFLLLLVSFSLSLSLVALVNKVGLIC